MAALLKDRRSLAALHTSRFFTTARIDARTGPPVSGMRSKSPLSHVFINETPRLGLILTCRLVLIEISREHNVLKAANVRVQSVQIAKCVEGTIQRNRNWKMHNAVIIE
ncbi:hypothetical protein Ac2012v2_005090 [Leucoagaricus gongylophorus]